MSRFTIQSAGTNLCLVAGDGNPYAVLSQTDCDASNKKQLWHLDVSTGALSSPASGMVLIRQIDDTSRESAVYLSSVDSPTAWAYDLPSGRIGIVGQLEACLYSGAGNVVYSGSGSSISTSCPDDKGNSNNVWALNEAAKVPVEEQ